MINGDLGNVILLIVLYCLQGVPLGLGLASLPYILKKYLSYKELATFTLAAYPFSTKFFWSPLVDSYYFASIGRRKSWIIPIQIVSGLFMVGLSFYIENMIKNADFIYELTFSMFFIILLFATQDIAVDGWAIEILQEENKSLASTCQSIGQTIGFFLSFTVFLAFNSVDFCNKYIFDSEKKQALVSISGYIYFWGIVNIVVSFLLVFKHEKHTENRLGFVEIYAKIYKLVKRPNYKYLILMLLTIKIGTSFHDSAITFLLAEKGLKESNLGFLAVIMLPIDISICSLVGYLLRKNENNELKFYYFGFLLKVFTCIYGLLILYSFPVAPEIPLYFYFWIILGNILGSISMNLSFVSICGYFNKIADLTISGSIITFLNTVNNLGSSIPRYLVYQGINYLTVKEQCFEINCPQCETICEPERHGYYPLAAMSLTFAVFYAYALKNMTTKIQNFKPNTWKIEPEKEN